MTLVRYWDRKNGPYEVELPAEHVAGFLADHPGSEEVVEVVEDKGEPELPAVIGVESIPPAEPPAPPVIGVDDIPGGSSESPIYDQFNPSNN